jgi:hypothetical protein
MVVSNVLIIHAHELNHTLSFDFCRCTDTVGHLASHLFPSCSAPMLRRSMMGLV